MFNRSATAREYAQRESQAHGHTRMLLHEPGHRLTTCGNVAAVMTPSRACQPARFTGTRSSFLGSFPFHSASLLRQRRHRILRCVGRKWIVHCHASLQPKCQRETNRPTLVPQLKAMHFELRPCKSREFKVSDQSETAAPKDESSRQDRQR